MQQADSHDSTLHLPVHETNSGNNNKGRKPHIKRNIDHLPVSVLQSTEPETIGDAAKAVLNCANRTPHKTPTLKTTRSLY